MQNYTREQWSSAIQSAYNAGDIAAANELAAAADRALGVQPETPAAPAEPAFDPTEGMGAGEKFLVGAGKGLTDVGRGAQDLWFRITGNDDALERLTERADAEDAMFERDLGDSGWATAGEIVGEVAATLPVGMGVAGVAGRAGLAANSTRVAMLDGAISEGLTQRGGLAERAGAAGMGAVGGAVGNEVMKRAVPAATRLASKAARRRLGSLREAEGLGSEAAARMQRAREDGGFTLDAAQASQNTDALYRRDELVRTSEDAANLAQQQEKDILAKADEFLARVGGYRDPLDMPKDARSRAANGMARALRSLKDADDAEVDRFYREWREAAGDEPIPVIGLREAAEKPFESATVAVRDEVGDQVQRIFDDYFLGDLNAGSRLMDSSGNPFGARTTSLTVGNFERLQQELNAIYRRSPNADTRRFIGQVKDSMNEHVSLSFQRVSDEGAATLNRGRKATEAYKQNVQRWSRDDLLTKMTEKSADGEMFRKNPKTSFDAMLRVGNSPMLRKAKNRMALSSDPTVRQSWQQMQQVPLIEAIEAARKAGQSNVANEAFSAKAFRRELAKYNSETLETLWGKDMTDQVKRAAMAWDLKDVRSTMQMQGRRQNPSGTSLVARGIAQAGLRISSTLSRVPVIGPTILMFPATANVAAGVWGRWKNQMDVRMLASGKLPATIQKELEAAAQQAFSKEVFDQFREPTIIAMREAIREIAQHDNDDT
ncbi:MAG: hypothetical protein AAFY29_03170 [Pseudomonadota bacterium]